MEEKNESTSEYEEQPEPGQPVIKPPANVTMILGGIFLLLIGIGLGYLGRGAIGPEAKAAHVTATAQAGVARTRAATNQQVMELISQQITHWKGNENAPVTMIEFSDYQ